MPANYDPATRSTHYGFRDLTPAVLTLNGSSILDLNPIEAKIGPEGWGYVVTLKDRETKATKQWVDGQYKLNTYWGALSITL